MWRDSESDHDFLNFTELADQVATLATDDTLLPISIGVFGTWGTGKSTVLKLVESRIAKPKEDGEGNTAAPVVVKFDAWLYQGFDDARAALMEVIATELQRMAKDNQTLFEKAKEFAGRINYFRGIGLIADFGIGMALGIPPGLLTHAGAAVSSVLARNVTEEQYGEIKGDAAETKKRLTELIKPANKKTPPEQIAAFRKQFGDLLDGLNTSLIVFIDNLDRCLPDVAISTLEAIRLFLFMPRTAFVIAADEDMIRHSVAKHFKDPSASHVRDYLDKVIQVPMRVPQVGPEDVRAYMYSLFVSVAAPDKLAKVQERLMSALQAGWKGATFEKGEINTLAGSPPDLLDRLAVADRLAPMLAWAPKIQGNPRIVKRLLNAVSLRRVLAANRQMNVDFATLAKLAVFERCTDGPATLALYQMVMDGKDEKKVLLPAEGGQDAAVGMLKEWAPHAEFIEQWRALDPPFDNLSRLRPAVFLSRDVMAPARLRSGLSEAAQSAVRALLKVDSTNSPVAKKVVEQLTLEDRQAAMSALIPILRQGDWSAVVPGVHGAVILANASAEAKMEFKAFVGGLQSGEMDKGIRYLLSKSGLIEGK